MIKQNIYHMPLFIANNHIHNINGIIFSLIFTFCIGTLKVSAKIEENKSFYPFFSEQVIIFMYLYSHGNFQNNLFLSNLTTLHSKHLLMTCMITSSWKIS